MIFIGGLKLLGFFLKVVDGLLELGELEFVLSEGNGLLRLLGLRLLSFHDEFFLLFFGFAGVALVIMLQFLEFFLMVVLDFLELVVFIFEGFLEFGFFLFNERKFLSKLFELLFVLLRVFSRGAAMLLLSRWRD